MPKQEAPPPMLRLVNPTTGLVIYPKMHKGTDGNWHISDPEQVKMLMGTDKKPTWSDGAGALEKAQDWPGLLAHCRQWTQGEPDNVNAWYTLGLAYANLGRWGEAIEAYREALRLKPDYTLAWHNLGLAYAVSGKRSAALEAVEELRQLDPQKAEKLFNLIMKP